MSKSRGDIEEFDGIYPELLKVLVNDISKDLDLVLPYFKEMTDYSVPHGKKIRGLMVGRSLKSLLPQDKQTPEKMKLGNVAGWCIEWFQACFLLHDDIMDESLTRRGEPCWYLKADKDKGLGLIAINDGLLLGSSLFILLEYYFKNQPYLSDLLSLFHKCFHYTALGQNMDMLTAPKNIDLDSFSINRYRSIVKWKTAYYTFYLPVTAAMIIAGVTEKKKLDAAEEILLEIGEFFQVQDDYLDCYGNPEITGKIGTDIQDGKCSWLIIKAMEKSSPRQLETLKENYGKHDKNSVDKIKTLYSELEIPTIYKQYEENSLERINRMIGKLNGLLPEDMFTSIVRSIFKRNK